MLTVETKRQRHLTGKVTFSPACPVANFLSNYADILHANITKIFFCVKQHHDHAFIISLHKEIMHVKETLHISHDFSLFNLNLI